MDRSLFLKEMIRSELMEIVGEGFVSTEETDKLVYSTDWAWMPARSTSSRFPGAGFCNSAHHSPRMAGR